ncbi:MAG: glycoside hydrolase family 3 N-terminal domain-containing protein, partial [Oscillospiraceae bacterium]
MKKAILLCLLCLALLVGCAATAVPPPETPELPPPPPTAEELAAKQVADLLAGMTVEEKVGQLFFPRCPTVDAVADIATYHLGGYLLFTRDFADKTAGEIIDTLGSYQRAAQLPLLLGVDEEGGSVVRISSNPHLRQTPDLSPAACLLQGGMETLLAETGRRDALLAGLGINVNLAPVCDLSAPGDFMGARSFGTNAVTVSDQIAAVVETMSADGMGTVLKHFPGYGNNPDTHTGSAVDSRPLEHFQKADFLPFAAGIQAGAGSVLVSHNVMAAVDAALPASLSPAVHGLLREELHFDGVVMTDDLAMEAVSAYATDDAIAVVALLAGNDLIVTTDYRTQIPPTIAAAKDGTLSPELLDGAVRRVL